MYNNSSTGKVTTQISGSNVTVNSAGGPAIGNSYISISDSTVSATGGGAGIDASYDLTITDSIVYAHSTGTYTIYSYYAGLKSSIGDLIVSGDSAVTATALCEGGVGVEGFNMVIEQGAVLSAEGWMAAVRAYNSITVPDSYLPEGYSIRQVFNTCDADDDIYTIAEDGAEVTYTYEYILGGSSTDILAGAATSVTLKEPEFLPEPEPEPEPTPDDPSGGQGGRPSSTTETVTNPDGSTTTTVTKPDGSTTETTRNPDGSQEIVETDKEGNITTTTTDADGNRTEVVESADGSGQITVDNRDGSSSATKVDENGRTESSVRLPAAVVEEAEGETLALPMPEVLACADWENASTVTVDLPGGTSVRVEIPVENVTAGTVAVIVKADGTEAVIRTSLSTENGVAVTLTDGDTVKIVDNSKNFDDVSDDYWGAQAVAFASSRELFHGTSANSFEPETAMTRAMIVTVLARLDGADTTTGSTWYEAGMQWAMANGISDGSAMEQNLSREQLAAMLWRYAGSPDAASDLGGYTDAMSVSSWARQAVAWCVEQGILNGTTNTKLSPRDEATRAEVAAMLLRFCQFVL